RVRSGQSILTPSTGQPPSPKQHPHQPSPPPTAHQSHNPLLFSFHLLHPPSL
ncbi:hypothetical protein KUCAC02_004583, partial [Chaenocephalus aceratus]